MLNAYLVFNAALLYFPVPKRQAKDQSSKLNINTAENVTKFGRSLASVLQSRSTRQTAISNANSTHDQSNTDLGHWRRGSDYRWQCNRAICRR